MDAKDFMPSEAVVAGIRADLERYEAERHTAYLKVLWRAPVFFGVLIVVVFLVAWLFNGVADPFEQWLSTPHVFLYFGAFVASFFVWQAAMGPATAVQASFRQHLLPIVFGFIEDMRYENEVTPQSFARLPRELLSSFNRQSFDDVITGRYEGFPFELYEATLRSKAGKNDVTIFKGVIGAFQLEKPFPGLLVARRQTGQVSRFFQDLFGAKGPAEVESGVPDIDAQYDFKTDNPSAAQPLVSGRLAQALGWLKETWPDGQPLVALKGEDGFLLLPQTKDYFELPPISTPLDFDKHIRPIVADMAALLATIALVRKIGGADDAAARQ